MKTQRDWWEIESAVFATPKGGRAGSGDFSTVAHRVESEAPSVSYNIRRAAREVAEDYRSRAGSTEDETRRLILEEISDAFSEFASWLEGE